VNFDFFMEPPGWETMPESSTSVLSTDQGSLRFLLDKSWKDHEFWEKSVQLARWWPRIVEQAEGISGGAAFQVPWNFRGKGQFKQLVL
jgi:hypothetical protein